jgi:hypothetical protein
MKRGYSCFAPNFQIIFLFINTSQLNELSLYICLFPITFDRYILVFVFLWNIIINFGAQESLTLEDTIVCPLRKRWTDFYCKILDTLPVKLSVWMGVPFILFILKTIVFTHWALCLRNLTGKSSHEDLVWDLTYMIDFILIRV